MKARPDSTPLPLARPDETQFLPLGGHRMAYHDQGPTELGDDGATILCVHGNPTWSFYYRKIAETFSDRHRVIRVDHIGCGESDKPPSSRFEYRLSNHQANLATLIRELDLQRIVLLAHDWGGAIGLGSLLAERKRFRGLMLLNTAAFPPPYIPRRISACRFPVLGPLAVRGANAFARAAITMAMSRTQMNEAIAKQFLSPYNSWANRVAIDAFVRDIPMRASHPTHQTLVELEEGLPTLADLPSLLVWGMQDWCFRPECLHRFQQVWPEATTVEIPDAGHYVMEDAPDEVLAAIETFLESRVR
ncbi:MAG: alpha/beta fold hydrolase [Planctomycetota bacterium]